MAVKTTSAGCADTFPNDLAGPEMQSTISHYADPSWADNASLDNAYPSKIGPAHVCPPNYGVVEDGKVHRSGYPELEHYSFIRDILRVKTIITLVPEPIPESYQRFLADNHIKHVQIHVPANKHGRVNVTQDCIDEVLLNVVQHLREPVLIHCNRGKHRTGCVVACLRKAHGWSDAAAVHDYRTYAGEKAREDDITFIQSYNAERWRKLIEECCMSAAAWAGLPYYTPIGERAATVGSIRV